MLRALLLTVALASGGVAAWLVGAMQPVGSGVADAAVSSEPVRTTQVLVAAAPVDQGAKLRADQLRWQLWPMEAVQDDYILRSDRANAIDELAGSIVRNRLAAGAPVLPSGTAPPESSFLSAVLSPGMRAVAIRVSAEKTAGGFVLPNDRVDVLLAEECRPQDGCKSGTTVRTILRNVRVLAIDQSGGESGSDDGVLLGKTATLELTPDQAETIIGAEASGTLSLVLRAAADHGEAPDTTRRSGRTVHVMRGGVSEYVSVD